MLFLHFSRSFSKDDIFLFSFNFSNLKAIQSVIVKISIRNAPITTLKIITIARGIWGVS